MENSQIKSKKRVREFAEVFTNEREVKAMCSLIPSETWKNIESTFLEPACGTGNFLVEIFGRKLKLCNDEREGLKALNSLFGIDIQEDNVIECRNRLLEMFTNKFPSANELCLKVANATLKTHIACDDFLNPQTDLVKCWLPYCVKSYLGVRK